MPRPLSPALVCLAVLSQAPALAMESSPDSAKILKGVRGIARSSEPFPRARRSTSILLPTASEVETSEGTDLRTPREINGGISILTRGLNQIYLEHLRSDSSLAGTLTFQLRIEADGTVSESSLPSSTTGNPRFDQECLAQTPKVRFNAIGSGTATIRFPLKFSSVATEEIPPHLISRPRPKASTSSRGSDRILANGDGSSPIDHRPKASTDSVDPRNANIVGISRGSGKKSAIATLLQDREAPKGRLVPVVASDIQLSGAKGLRTQDEILVVLRQHTGWFVRLYRDQLRDDPNLAGTMKLLFQIQADGTVTEPSVASSTTGNENFDYEILSDVRHMRFAPIPTGIVAVRCPLTFEPVKPRD